MLNQIEGIVLLWRMVPVELVAWVWTLDLPLTNVWFKILNLCLFIFFFLNGYANSSA